MLPSLFAVSLSFPLKGRWVGKFTNSFEQEFNFSITFKVVGIRFQGIAKVPPNQKFLPKRVDVREIRINRTFVIFLPLAAQEKFAQIDLVKGDDQNLTGSVQSEDGVYNVTLTITRENRIELVLVGIKRGEWYRYELEQKRRVQVIENKQVLEKQGVWALVVVLLMIVVGWRACGGNGTEKEKGE
jgi:hypothetical protein